MEVEDVKMTKWWELVTTRKLDQYNIRRLLPDQWLNDDIIDDYCNLCDSAVPTQERLRAAVLTPLFAQGVYNKTPRVAAQVFGSQVTAS
jgi:hypothetical protein